MATSDTPGEARASKGRVFLLDGTALAYRSHFALIRQPLLTSKGQNISALFVFANTLFKILESERPDFLAVAFDPHGKTFRHEAYGEYKATRERTPDELIAMLPALRELVEGFGAPILEIPGFEADDVIATVARQAEQAGHEVFIVTGDKDFLQIVSPTVKLYNVLRQGVDVEIQGEEAALAKFGVKPAQVIDVLALMGDSSDNVPGVSGIGPKTATELIQSFGSVEQLYERLHEVKKAAVREKLEKDRESALLSKRLVTIDLAAPVAFDVDGFRYRGPSSEKLGALFRAYEMNSLMRRISASQQEDEHRYEIVRDAASFERFQRELAGAKHFVFDTETTGLDPLRAKLVGVSISFAPREAWYLPVNAEPSIFGSREADLERIVAALRPAFADPTIGKRGQNAKYDLLLLRKYGIDAVNVDFDTMIASYCVSPGELQHNLDHLALKYLNFRKIATRELIGSGKTQVTMDLVDVEKVGRYACEDVDIAHRLIPLLESELEGAGVGRLFAEVEMPLMRVLERMEAKGVRVDVDLLKRLSVDFEHRIMALTTEIHGLAGEAFNINSPKQLGQILFDKLEVHKALGGKKPRKTQTGWSTDAAVLEAMAGHPLPSRILEYRGLVKLKGTYIDALPALVNPDTGRIHTSFNQAVAATGRLSSSDPNLQNIPIRTAEGAQIRRAFVPESANHVLFSADYSQVELRLLAHLSQDPNLMKAFREGQDVHRWTAGLIFGLDPTAVPAELRARAKTINFGVIYGMGAQRLAAETDMSPKDAQAFIDAYFQTFAGVRRFLDSTLDRARADGFVTTMLGRRRYIAELESEHPRIAAQARNVAINTPIQGTAADLIKVAMIRIQHELDQRKLKTAMILQVHDELVFDVPREELDTVAPLVTATMEGALALDVPLKVECGSGADWLAAHS